MSFLHPCSLFQRIHIHMLRIYRGKKDHAQEQKTVAAAPQVMQASHMHRNTVAFSVSALFSLWLPEPQRFVVSMPNSWSTLLILLSQKSLFNVFGTRNGLHKGKSMSLSSTMLLHYPKVLNKFSPFINPHVRQSTLVCELLMSGSKHFTPTCYTCFLVRLF